MKYGKVFYLWFDINIRNGVLITHIISHNLISNLYLLVIILMTGLLVIIMVEIDGVAKELKGIINGRSFIISIFINLIVLSFAFDHYGYWDKQQSNKQLKIEIEALEANYTNKMSNIVSNHNSLSR